MALASVALVFLGIFPPHVVSVAVFGFAAGLGLGSIMPINQLVAQTVAGRARLGVAIAMLSMFRSAGGAVGASLFGALVFALMPEENLRFSTHTLADAARPAVIRAFHIAFLAAAALAAVGVYVASRAPQTRLWPVHDETTNAAKRGS
jgi:MFS family permease